MSFALLCRSRSFVVRAPLSFALLCRSRSWAVLSLLTLSLLLASPNARAGTYAFSGYTVTPGSGDTATYTPNNYPTAADSRSAFTSYGGAPEYYSVVANDKITAAFTWQPNNGNSTADPPPACAIIQQTSSVSWTSGTTPDSSGNLHILIGQLCTATLGGIPVSFSGLQWTATGKTLQGWTGGNGGSTGAPYGLANPYTWSQPHITDPGPAWYWSDVAGNKTITCTATVTPPIGQGSAFSVTATRTVTLDVPAWTESDSANPTRIDNQYPPISGYALWAGSLVINNNGSQWNDSVTLPPNLYTGNGDWAHLQIISVNGTHTIGGTATPVPNSGTTGLDGGFPYRTDGSVYIDSGQIVSEGDSPGIALLDDYTNYTLNYSYDLYVMYIPPGSQSIWVPLTKLTWTWAPNVNRPAPSGHWSGWPAGTAPGGNPVVPASGTRCTDEPSWTTKISAN